MMKRQTKESLWNKQNEALRDPQFVFANDQTDDGIAVESLQYELHGNFVDLIEQHKLTLLITREYEHLAIALSAPLGQLRQSFIHIAHPCGIAVNRKTNSVYIAATRNPNQVWEFLPNSGLLDRIEQSPIVGNEPYLMPTRVKVLAGAYYLHDLAFIGDELYGNSVNHNAIIPIDFSKPGQDRPMWWPSCIEKSGTLQFSANYIQLNSIAAGSDISQSYFSASGDEILATRPKDPAYPVDKKGVIFSGKTHDVYARGLTRPHSARIYNGNVWVANSGYGEVGYITNGKLTVVAKLPSWTRGLCLIDQIAFVGVSRVLPKFKSYAPGLTLNWQQCGVFAIDIKSGNVLGSITWPYGNQIFAIDWLPNTITPGFPYTVVGETDPATFDLFYRYQT